MNPAKRHKEWASFTSPLCVNCLQQHVWKYLVRYPVLANTQEVCHCPCGHATDLTRSHEGGGRA
jgi:hypothetical protein